jgi:hypothetical protein
MKAGLKATAPASALALAHAAVRADLHPEDGDGRTASVYFLKRPKRRE